MFELRYLLSLVIPLVLLVVYTISLQWQPSLAAVARPSSPRSKFQKENIFDSGLLSQASVITTDELTSTYEIFVLEQWCLRHCQEQVSKTLHERFACEDVSYLCELHYFQARCAGMSSKSAYEIGEEVVRTVKGVKQHVDNKKLPSANIGERVDSRSLSSHFHKDTSGSSLISRMIQTITGMLPWALDRIDQEEGKDGRFDLSCFPKLGKGVTIYVLDTGCRDTHEDLKGRTTLEKVERYPTPVDDNGHGTHIAASAAGTNYGVCKFCNVVCIKVLDQNNVGTIVDIVDSIELVLEQKKANPQIPSVAVMSFGGNLDTDLLDIGVNRLAKANVFPAVAAGNGFTNSCDWTPPRAKHAVTVGATMQDDQFRFSSNYGKCVNIVAPGENIRSASHLGDSLYVSMSGTSMAAPFVAGVAALMLGEDPALAPSQILQKMKLRAKILDDGFHNSKYPMLRILYENCSLYSFGNKEPPYPGGTSEVHQREASPSLKPEYISSSPRASSSPFISGSVAESATLSLLTTSALPSSNLASASPWPSTSQAPFTSSTSTPAISQFPSPSTTSTVSPSVSVSVSPFPILEESLTSSSSSTPSISLSISQSPSAIFMPNQSKSRSPSPTPSIIWLLTASATPWMLPSEPVYPSQPISVVPSSTSTPGFTPSHFSELRPFLPTHTTSRSPPSSPLTMQSNLDMPGVAHSFIPSTSHFTETISASSSLHPGTSSSTAFPTKQAISVSPQTKASVVPIVSASQTSQPSNAQSSSPSVSTQSMPTFGMAENQTERISPSPSPSPFRFQTDTIS